MKPKGFVLLPVVLILAILAAVALLTNRDSALGTRLLAGDAEADAARYVTEAGLQHALWQTRQQGCGPYIDIAETFGSHSYTTTLATDLGATSSYSLAVDQDAWIRSDQPTTNKATDSKLHIRFEGVVSERPMYRYDLSPLPASASILSAAAWFYVSKDHPEGPADIHRLTADWTETDATWATMSGNMESAVLATIPTQPTAGVWVAVNLRAQVQAWVDGQPNYGISLNATTQGIHGDYASREASEQPYLEVVVGTPPSSPATLQSVGTLASGVSRTIMRDDLALYQQPPSFAHWQPDAAEASDAYISDANPTTNYGNDVDTRVSQDTNNISLSLFRFDTAAIPAGAKIFDATLSLLRQSGSGIDVPVTAHRIVNPWNEGYVTWERRDNGISWDTQGGDLDPRVVSTTLVGPANNIRYEWELTTLGQGWVDGTYGNFGVALRTEEPGISGERFFTSDHANLAFHPRLTITYACGCAVACAATGGAPVSAKIILSTKSTARLGGLTFTDKDLAEYDPDPDTATLYLDGAAVGVTQDIDAVHVLANGHLVLSTINTVTLAGLTFENEDLVEYDPVADTATMLFDGSTLFSGGSTDVSAVHVTDSGHLVLSNEYDVTLGGLSFEPNDLVDYDPATDTAVLLLDGDAVGLVGWINAVHLLANGHIVLSTEASATLGGLSFNPGDLVDYDPVADTASLHFDGALFSSTEDVRSAHVGDGGGGTAAAAPALWLSTLDDVTSSGAPGLDAWTDGEALEIADPNLALEPGATDGTFSSVFNLDDFAGDADIDAIHYVDNDITVGSSNSVDLLAGDVLLSTDVDETLTSSNSLAVNDEDVFVFRPETLGDYSAGTFIFLIDGSQIHSESDTVGVSLVEKDTTVGDGSLTKGSFILATTSRRDVQLFAADDVGLDRTSGSVTEFIDGPSLSLGSEIRGLDLAEDEVIVGGHTIAAGSILVTLDNDDTGGVGDNMIPVDSADVFYLTVTQTGASPIADAVLLFEGLDVSLDTSQEHVQALTLTNATSAGDSGPPPPPADCTYSDNFNNQSYANSDGNAAWGSNWTEEGESTNPTGGDIRVINDASDFQLRVQDDDNKIWRELDLSGGHASATLSFEYRRQSLESNAEYVAVEVSNNGGGSWTEIRGPATEDGYTGVSYDISSYMAANTRIRYVSPSGGMSNGDDVYFDNVKIEAIGGTCP